MGFSTVILGIMLLIAGLFFVQNLQPVALIFFGFNSVTLPLSLWSLIALLSGVIMSLLVNLLLGSNSPSPPQYPDNPPPSPSRNPRRSTKESVKSPNEYPETLEEESIKQYPPKVNQPSTIIEDDEFDFLEEDDDIFPNKTPDRDSPPPPINTQEKEENSQSPPENPLKKDESFEVSSSSPLEVEKPQENKPLITPPPQEDSMTSETVSKTRDASPYSYLSGEKTQIRPVSPPPRKKPVVTNKGEVYDVPYRVINASEEPDNIYDDEEDWDF